MVLHKRLDHGSSGYQVPVVPHVPKSARGKRSVRKKVEENKMCAFDLLATVADQLLMEGKSFLGPCSISGTPCPTAGNDIVKEEKSMPEISIKSEILDQHSCSGGLLGSEIVLKKDVDYDVKDQSHASEILASDPASTNFEISNKHSIAEESIVIGPGGEVRFGAIPENCHSERHPSNSMDSHKSKGEEVKTPTRVEKRMLGTVLDVNTLDPYNSEDPMDLDTKPPALVSSDSSAEVPDYRSKPPQNSSFPKSEHGLELAIDKDDDENSSGCTHPSILVNKPSRVQRIGDRRIRKLLASKYWNSAPTVSHEAELSSYDVETKPLFHGKKMCYMRQRTHRGPFKRKKVLERCPVPDVGIYHGSMSNLCEKPGIKSEQSDPSATLRGVKLNISSFKIPEIFIEMPETATVGSLKRTIMEAVTAILGGGLRVGVLLQGKKVRDDNKTLRQAGILQSDKLDNLGFMLEPNRTQVSPPLATFEDPHLPSFAASAELSARIEPISTAPLGELSSDVALAPPPLMMINPESDHDSVYSPVDASSLDKITTKSQALLIVPPVNADSMAVVPVRKPRRSEVVQRRIRRPFSVAEVEALVQAVEKLGTGRWRDVKLRAFDNAKHRTYVDLKDKWKTLVHTARISPQQRRGEPVPQELLDRVLAAHAYWSQQQAKLHVKPPSAETCLLIQSHN